MELCLEELIASNAYLTYPSKSKFAYCFGLAAQIEFLLYDHRPFLSKLPAHFYGELCRTPEGCNLLKKKGYFNSMAKLVQAYYDDPTSCSLMELKAALWAIVIIIKLILSNTHNLDRALFQVVHLEYSL
jgi:rapamycin-insensitive companion of mTOR